jgi:hypothetical protein
MPLARRVWVLMARIALVDENIAVYLSFYLPGRFDRTRAPSAKWSPQVPPGAHPKGMRTGNRSEAASQPSAIIYSGEALS